MRPEIRRRVGEAAVLALYFVYEARDVWPRSHGEALILGGIGISAVLLIELSLKPWAIFSAAVGAALAIFYCVVGPARVPTVEVTGTLQAGNAPTRVNPTCRNVPADALQVIFGDNTIERHTPGRFVALRIGKCDVIAMERTAMGVSIDADLYDEAGGLIARVRNKEIHALSGENSSVSRGNDLSTLIVKDGDGREILNLHYVNENTLVAEGVFGCPGHKLVVVKSNEPMAGSFFHESCFQSAGGGISIQ